MRELLPQSRSSRLLWGLLCLVFVASAGIAGWRIANAPQEVTVALVAVVLALAAARPAITNILWALHVLCVLPGRTLSRLIDRLEGTPPTQQQEEA